MRYLSKMVGFLSQQCYVCLCSSQFGWVWFILLPCYVKSVLLPSQRKMCRGGTWQYGLACVSSYSVFRVKSE